MRARGGRAGRRRGVRQDALRDPVSPCCSLAASCNLQARFVKSGLGVLLKLCASSLGLRVCRGGSIQRAVRRMAGGGGRRSGGSARAGSGGGGAPASCSGVGSFLPDDQSPLFLKLLFCHTTAIFQNPYDNFCAILVHRSRIFCSENFGKNARVVLYFRQAVCSRSVFGGPDDKSLSPLLIALTGSSLPL